MASAIPKPLALRQRRNKAASHTTIEAPPAARVDLTGPHEPRTLAWWAVIWDSPISAEWVDADVPGLMAIAALWDEFWTALVLADRTKAAAEIRMQSAQYGLTPMARRSLQWEVKRVERASAKPSETVAPTRRRDPRLRALG